MSRVAQAVSRRSPAHPTRPTRTLLVLGAALIVPSSVLVGLAFGPPVGVAASVVAAGTWATIALDPSG